MKSVARLATAIIFVGLSSNASATLITGDWVADANGIDWEYVGQFDLADGPFWNDADDRCINATGSCTGLFAPAINGVQAAERLFGVLPSGEYAISTIETLVNRLAWYDLFREATIELGDSILADVGGDGLYSQQGDRSAYVTDRQVSKINLVFKSLNDTPEAPVPVPATLGLLSLGFLGLGWSRRNKA